MSVRQLHHTVKRAVFVFSLPLLLHPCFTHSLPLLFFPSPPKFNKEVWTLGKHCTLPRVLSEKNDSQYISVAVKLFLIVNRQINVSLLSRNIKLLWTSFDLLTDRLMPSVTDRLLIMYGILLRRLFFVAAVLYSGSCFFYMADVNNFFSELDNAYFSRHLF